MNNFAAFIGHMIASKVLVDGQQIPYEHYKKFSPHLTELENWAGVFTGLELDKPATWAATGQKLISRISNRSGDKKSPRSKKKKVNPFDLAMTKINYTQMNKSWYLADLIWEAVEKAPEEIVWFDDAFTYSKIKLEGDQFMMRRQKRYKKAEFGGGFPGGADALQDVLRRPSSGEEAADEVEDEDILIGDDTKPLYPKAGEIYIPNTADDSEEKALFFRAVGKMLFEQRSGKFFSIDWSNDKHTFLVEPLKFPDRLYKGEALNYIEDWKRFMASGIRRCVCLQGDPGTGKSTLTRTAAMQLNRRTVQVTSEAFRRMQFTHWKTMISLISPEVLILDDIDRIYDLDEYLNRFEDAYYKVPLTLFTSNDLEEIPDAFKRPGRIDQILLLGDPSPAVRLSVLQEFAQMEGVGEIPAWKTPFMERLYSEYSGAYAVEYLRRVKVFGWEYELPEGDLTFEGLVGKEAELDPRKNPDLDSEILNVVAVSADTAEVDVESLS